MCGQGPGIICAAGHNSSLYTRISGSVRLLRVGWPLAFLLAPASFISGPVGDALAQQQPAGKVFRIGFLSQGQPPKENFEVLQQGLRERGYVESRNLIWEFRSTDGSLDQQPQFAEELVRLKVDVILARNSSCTMAAKRATTSIPNAFFAVYAPVELGLASRGDRWPAAADVGDRGDPRRHPRPHPAAHHHAHIGVNSYRLKDKLKAGLVRPTEASE